MTNFAFGGFNQRKSIFNNHKLVLSLRSKSTLKISLPSKQNLPQKEFFIALLAPRRQSVTLNGATSKGKAINTIGGHGPPAVNQLFTTEDTSSSSPQGAVADFQAPPQQYECQILQMLADMKEQHAQSDHDREQVAHDRENVICEHEALKRE